MQKKRIIIFLLSIIAMSLQADQITKIAVVDYNRILSVYYHDSGDVRQIQQFEEQLREEILSQDSHIKGLEAELLEARSQGNDREVLRLETEIQEKKNFLADFIRVKKNQLEDMKRRLSVELGVVEEILDGIQYVAESNGFSMVFRKDDPSVLWYSYDVDLTDQILDYLQ